MGSKWGCGDDGGGFSAHGAALCGSDRGRAHESPGSPPARKDFRDGGVSGDGCGDGETVPGPAAGVRARRTESVCGGERLVGTTRCYLRSPESREEGQRAKGADCGVAEHGAETACRKIRDERPGPGGGVRPAPTERGPAGGRP